MVKRQINGIKAVMLDLDNTIYPHLVMKENIIENLSRVDKNKFHGKKIDREISLIYKRDGIKDIRKILKILLEREKVPNDIRKKIIRENELEFRKFINTIKKTLGKIKKLNLKIGIITNSTYPEALKRVRDLEIEKFLDLIVTLKNNRKKPFPDLFNKAIKRLKVKPYEILYVGDHLIEDVIPSKYVGMRTVLFKNRPKWYHRKLVQTDRFRLIAPDCLIDGLDQIPGIIEKLNKPE